MKAWILAAVVAGALVLVGVPAHGDGRHFKMHKLTAKQKDALADRLDQRASQLHKAATCLRRESDAATCFKRSFSPPQRRG
jgi:hypothetical protein